MVNFSFTKAEMKNNNRINHMWKILFHDCLISLREDVHILCGVFALFSSSCIVYIASFSGVFIFDCPLGNLQRLFKPATFFYSGACPRPGKWAVMYMCQRYHFPLFLRFSFEFRNWFCFQHDISSFFSLLLMKQKVQKIYPRSSTNKYVWLKQRYIYK